MKKKWLIFFSSMAFLFILVGIYFFYQYRNGGIKRIPDLPIRQYSEDIPKNSSHLFNKSRSILKKFNHKVHIKLEDKLNILLKNRYY